ncbi:MAG: hypothetical protein IIA73_04845 [Proteobacteria bacterium]|nr:hypothetical protein [Pseudomonadota bacterium]
MEGVKAAFNDKVDEVERYFLFLQSTLEKEVHLLVPSNGSDKTFRVDEELKKILKANTFLILYNLVESTVRTAIEEIFERLRHDQRSYQHIREELKQLWIRDGLKGVERSGGSPHKYRVVAKSLVENAIRNNTVNFDVDNLPISGNIDANEIRNLAKKFGFSEKTHWRAKGGETLLTVKDRRNRLAHGNISFGECGRDFDGKELMRIKSEVIIYLRSFIRNVEKYLAKKQYENSTS